MEKKTTKTVMLVAMILAMLTAVTVKTNNAIDWFKNLDFVPKIEDSLDDDDYGSYYDIDNFLDFSEGYITNSHTEIETDYVIFSIEEGIYVRNDLSDVADETCRVIEDVTGLYFSDGPLYNGKIHVNVTKDPYDEGGLTKSEYGASYAHSTGVELCPIDLFIGHSDMFIYNMAMELQYMYYDGFYAGIFLPCGHASYTTIKVLDYFYDYEPDMLKYYSSKDQIKYNLEIVDDAPLFENNLSNLLEGEEYYSGNEIFAYGTAFMEFIDEDRHGYSDWIECIDDFFMSKNDFYTISSDEMADFILEVYSEDVYDSFLDWYSDNKSRFTDVLKEHDYHMYVDASYVFDTFIFPEYGYLGNKTCLWGENTIVKYDYLTIHLEPLYYYLGVYKEEDISSLKMIFSSPVDIDIYNRAGEYVTTKENEMVLSLVDVGKVVLADKGETQVSVIGYEEYSDFTDNRYVDLDDKVFNPTSPDVFIMALRASVSTNEPINITVSDSFSVIDDDWLILGKSGKVTIEDGRLLVVAAPIDVYGEIEYSKGEVICNNQRLWLKAGGRIIRDDAVFTETLNADYDESDSYSPGFAFEDLESRVYITAGYKSTLYIDGISKADFDKNYEIGWVNTGGAIFLNGEKIY